jgi:hypothetical protein
MISFCVHDEAWGKLSLMMAQVHCLKEYVLKDILEWKNCQPYAINSIDFFS